MEDNRTFGEIVRQEREKRKVGNPSYSLRKFAKMVELSPTFLSKIETDEFTPPAADKIKNIAAALDLDPNMLLAKANKLDPDFKRIVTENQVELASFLRTIDGMSKAQLERMAEFAEQVKKDVI